MATIWTDKGVSATTIQGAVDSLPSTGGVVYLAPETSAGYYEIDSVITLPNNVTIEGLAKDAVVLRPADSHDDHIFINSDTVGTNTSITVRNLTIEGNGANQSAGSGIYFRGVENCTLENLVVNDVYGFGIFLGGADGTALTGTMTFTKDSTAVTGSGTLFTSELAVGDFIRTGGTSKVTFEIESITDDTNLVLRYRFLYTTESAVSATKLVPNRNFQANNITMDKSYVSDILGGGIWVDSNLSNIYTRDGGSFGLGFTSCSRVNFSNISIETPKFDGIGCEGGADLRFSNINVIRAGSAGFKFIYGSADIQVDNCSAVACADGFSASWFSATKSYGTDVQFSNCLARDNGRHGFRAGSVQRPNFFNCIAMNNGQTSTGYGFSLADDQSLPVDSATFSNCIATDTQDTPTQEGGIFFDTGTTNTRIIGGYYSGNKTSTYAGDKGDITMVGQDTIGVNEIRNYALFNNVGTTASSGDSTVVYQFDNSTMISTRTFSLVNGSPESNVTAPPGSLAVDYNGGGGTTLYVKESGTSNTGWVGK